MIFNCVEQGRWHSWFAWYPVRVQGDKIVWLETIKRFHNRTATFPWKYRIIFQVKHAK